MYQDIRDKLILNGYIWRTHLFVLGVIISSRFSSVG